MAVLRIWVIFIFWYVQKSVNKFLAPLPRTGLVLGGSVENLGDLHILVCTKINQQVFGAVAGD